MLVSELLNPDAWKSPPPQDWQSPTPTSVPDNTLERPLTPQLTCHTNPIVEEDGESISAINYQSKIEEEEEDVAPAGYIYNDPRSCHFYPVYVKNLKFGETRIEPKIVLASFIKYATDYTYVSGTMGIGHKIHTIPVVVGRRAHFYEKVMAEQWRQLQRGNEHKFAVNKVLTQLGDLRLTGEVNQYRNYTESHHSLENTLREAQHRVNSIMKEAITVEQELEASKDRLELANTYREIKDRFHSTFGRAPLQQPTPTTSSQSSREQMPLTLHRGC